MLLAKVVGTLVSTKKDPKVDGLKFLVLRQVNPETLREGAYVVANDAVGCGCGEGGSELLLHAESSSAVTNIQSAEIDRTTSSIQ